MKIKTATEYIMSGPTLYHMITKKKILGNNIPHAHGYLNETVI